MFNTILEFLALLPEIIGVAKGLSDGNPDRLNSSVDRMSQTIAHRARIGVASGAAAHQASRSPDRKLN